MKYSKLFLLGLVISFCFSCNSDEGEDIPETTITSFSGTIEFQNGEPVTSAELLIGGSEGGITGSAVLGANLLITDGTFEVTLETEEDVRSYTIVISILDGTSIINGFGFSEGLECLPGDCRDFPPGESHELRIIVPCNPDDCVLFPPNN